MDNNFQVLDLQGSHECLENLLCVIVAGVCIIELNLLIKLVTFVFINDINKLMKCLKLSKWIRQDFMSTVA